MSKWTSPSLRFLLFQPTLLSSAPTDIPDTLIAAVPAPSRQSALMCTEHTTTNCPACGKDYLVYVEFCKKFHPPLLQCPEGTSVNRVEMQDGRCPSPVCPNSRNGGCVVM